MSGTATLIALAIAIGQVPLVAPSASTDLSTAHRLVGLVDYLAADYPMAVRDGVVLSSFEYDEQRSLVAEAVALGEALPATGDDQIQLQLMEIQSRIGRRANPAEVAEGCARVKESLVARYRLPTFPVVAPSAERGRELYAQGCATCHGDDGRADLEFATTLNPPPSNFHAPEVANDLSPFRIFNTLSFGVPGTSMPSYGEAWSEQDRWAVAFFVSSLRFAGFNRTDHDLTPLPLTLAELASRSDREILSMAEASGLTGDDATRALAAARTTAPYEVPPEPLELARRLLDHAIASSGAGAWDEASRAALDAYLHGVEPIEGPLRAADPRLTINIEAGFLDLRDRIQRHAAVADIEVIATSLDNDLLAAQTTLREPNHSSSWAFLAAFFIVLREGVEAALVVGALLTVLRRAHASAAVTNRVHAGWITAIVAGVMTWFLARTLIPIGPAQRELAEGVIALVAAVLLFSASYWLISNLEVRHWLDFLKRRVAGSVAHGRALTLFSVAFLAVYREVFETVLFLQAMLLGGSRGIAIASGTTAALLALVVVVRAMFQLGAKLPLKAFFGISSGLLGLLAFALAGKGIHTLHQIGALTTSRFHGPELPLLGIHPTIAGFLAQGIIVTLFVAATAHSLWFSARRPVTPGPAANAGAAT